MTDAQPPLDLAEVLLFDRAALATVKGVPASGPIMGGVRNSDTRAAGGATWRGSSRRWPRARGDR